MKVIGITGGVGSGKSTITEILKDNYSAFLINTDQIAHMLMKKGKVSYNLIVEYFGDGVLDNAGEISRASLGAIVYQNPSGLAKLNSFTHPFVMDYVRDLIQQKQNENVTMVCIETALPKDAQLSDLCDEIWYIYAPEDVRRERIKNSRDYSDDKISNIFKNQMKEEEFKQICTQVIDTNDTMENIKEQIAFLVEK